MLKKIIVIDFQMLTWLYIPGMNFSGSSYIFLILLDLVFQNVLKCCYVHIHVDYYSIVFFSCKIFIWSYFRVALVSSNAFKSVLSHFFWKTWSWIAIISCINSLVGFAWEDILQGLLCLVYQSPRESYSGVLTQVWWYNSTWNSLE